ncbi:MAG: flagellar basal-body rod protein FlgG [Gemmatimonadota bacterium]
MDPSLRTAASGMIAQQTRIEVISNNLANVNTTGFKRSRAHFEDLLYQNVQGATTVDTAEAETLAPMQIGRGTRLAAVRRIDLQGPVEITGRPLDLAIEGDGYFQVELPSGRTAYTRDGSFTLSDRGSIVTSSGYALVPGVNVPEDAGTLSISSAGVVTFTSGTSGQPMEIGRIELARFTNTAGLEALGENLLAETPASGAPILGFAQDEGYGRILSGTLEASNVEIVQEMVEMISALRAYEIGSRALESSEQMSEIATRLGR